MNRHVPCLKAIQLPVTPRVTHTLGKLNVRTESLMPLASLSETCARVNQVALDSKSVQRTKSCCWYKAGTKDKLISENQIHFQHHTTRLFVGHSLVVGGVAPCKVETHCPYINPSTSKCIYRDWEVSLVLILLCFLSDVEHNKTATHTHTRKTQFLPCVAYQLVCKYQDL